MLVRGRWVRTDSFLVFPSRSFVTTCRGGCTPEEGAGRQQIRPVVFGPVPPSTHSPGGSPRGNTNKNGRCFVSVLPPPPAPSRNKQKKREHDHGWACHEETRTGGVHRRLPDTIGGGRSWRWFRTRFVHGIAGVTFLPHHRSDAGSTGGGPIGRGCFEWDERTATTARMVRPELCAPSNGVF